MPFTAQVQQMRPLPGGIGALVEGLQAAHAIIGLPGAIQAAKDIAEAHDPNSPRSKLAREEYKGGVAGMTNKFGYNPEAASKLNTLVEGTKDEQGNVTTPAMTAAQLDKNPESSLASSTYRTNITADAQRARGNAFADRNAVSVAKDYEKTLQPYRQLNEDVSKLESIFKTRDKSGNPLISPQQMGDANQIISRIYSPTHMSDATVSRTEYESTPARFASAIQKISANPTDVGSRDLIEHMVDQAHHLANVSNDNALRELDSLDQGYQMLADPHSRAMAANKSAFFKQRFSSKYPEIGSGGSGEAVASAQPKESGGILSRLGNLIMGSSASAQPDMVSVVSPEGQPGQIPRGKLQEAQKRGFKIQ